MLSIWMIGFPPLPPWATYRSLTAFRLVDLDKRMGMLPMGIGETLIQSLSKLVLRAVGYQANADYGNLQLCTGLEDFIEEVTHAMG